MIKDFLRVAGGSDANASHNLQATTQAWCAWYGVNDTSRAMLGSRHQGQVFPATVEILLPGLSGNYVACCSTSGWSFGYLKPSSTAAAPPAEARAPGESGKCTSCVPSPSVMDEPAEQAGMPEADVLGGAEFDPSNPFNEKEHVEMNFDDPEGESVIPA